ncbi:putative Zinc metalloproteinase nas-14 [Hypsibius exemplaris]|uniref:Metalloendopeptidase n=1 Tax=Hypsibius exemplaris TaxID=2072580 RepID=A0A9X6NA42_HYPEX|nr:putative Zinc metalloproteinase nas-14 [Hypsibius exemplaris]
MGKVVRLKYVFVKDVQRKKAQNGLTDQRSRWVNGVIPYYIAEGFNQKQQGVIWDAMDDFSSQTCIKFQPLSIIQHELMHVVGFFHEQSKSDRNDFVDINENNLDPEDFQRNFLDWSAAEVMAFGFPYDFGSIMHYSTIAFSKDGFSWTIRPKKEWTQYETVMGQRNSLNQIDIGKINAMYNCPERGGAKPNQPPPPTSAPTQPTKLFSSSSPIGRPDDGGDDQTTTVRPSPRPCENIVNLQGLSCTRCYTVSGPLTTWNDQCLPATSVRQSDNPSPEATDRQCRKVKKDTDLHALHVVGKRLVTMEGGLSMEKVVTMLFWSSSRTTTMNSLEKIFYVSLFVIGSWCYCHADDAVPPASRMMAKKWFEGDIMGIDPIVIAANKKKKGAKNGVVDENQRWKNGKIPYTMAEGFTLKQQGQLIDAMDDFSLQTCIKFVPLSDEQDYVQFETYPESESLGGCGGSPIGRMHGPQRLILSTANGGECFIKGVIQHELMHAVGFYHEQSRTDRDDYVDINMANLDHETFLRNFQSYSALEVTAFGFPYDFESIMHYPKNAFAKDESGWTIKPKPQYKQYEETMGQRVGLSQTDIGKINAMYKCPNKPIAKQKQPPTTTEPTTAPLTTTEAPVVETEAVTTSTTTTTTKKAVQTTFAPDDSEDVTTTTKKRRTTTTPIEVTEAPAAADPADDTDLTTPTTEKPKRTSRRRPLLLVAKAVKKGDPANGWPTYLQEEPGRTCEDELVGHQVCRTCTTTAADGRTSWKNLCQVVLVNGGDSGPKALTGIRTDEQCVDSVRGSQTCKQCTWMEDSQSRWSNNCSG